MSFQTEQAIKSVRKKQTTKLAEIILCINSSPMMVSFSFLWELKASESIGLKETKNKWLFWLGESKQKLSLENLTLKQTTQDMDCNMDFQE